MNDILQPELTADTKKRVDVKFPFRYLQILPDASGKLTFKFTGMIDNLPLFPGMTLPLPETYKPAQFEVTSSVSQTPTLLIADSFEDLIQGMIAQVPYSMTTGPCTRVEGKLAPLTGFDTLVGYLNPLLGGYINTTSGGNAGHLGYFKTTDGNNLGVVPIHALTALSFSGEEIAFKEILYSVKEIAVDVFDRTAGTLKITAYVANSETGTPTELTASAPDGLSFYDLRLFGYLVWEKSTDFDGNVRLKYVRG